jgi:hypothetical protein
VSPLTIDLKTRGKLGAVFDIERQSKIYCTILPNVPRLPNFVLIPLQYALTVTWKNKNIGKP